MVELGSRTPSWGSEWRRDRSPLTFLLIQPPLFQLHLLKIPSHIFTNPQLHLLQIPSPCTTNPSYCSRVGLLAMGPPGNG